MNLVPMLCHMHLGVIVLVFGIVMLFSFGINNSAYAVHDIHVSRGIDESHSGMRSSALPSETNLPQEHHPPGKLVIIEGPWEFKIPINIQ